MPKPEEKQDTFTEVIQAIESVEFEEEKHLSVQIDNSLREAIRAAQASNKGASVTITLKVVPGADRRITFAANVSAKLPRPPLAAAMLYADAAGNVHRSDPAQKPLPFPKPAPRAEES